MSVNGQGQCRTTCSTDGMWAGLRAETHAGRWGIIPGEVEFSGAARGGGHLRVKGEKRKAPKKR